MLYLLSSFTSNTQSSVLRFNVLWNYELTLQFNLSLFIVTIVKQLKFLFKTYVFLFFYSLSEYTVV